MNREDRRAAQRRATQATRAADGNPAVAAELDALRNVRTGSYALMQALVARMGGGPLDIPRGEWKALPPKPAAEGEGGPGHPRRAALDRAAGRA